MQNYKKGLLTAMVLSAMSLMAAEDKTIYVNTFDDIDDNNSSKCSLRLALKTAAANKAYGGCNVGNTIPSSADTIQLEAGTYNLNSELVPTSEVVINGKEPSDYNQKDAITNQYPALTTLQTKISGQGKVRLFNTTDAKTGLTLNNIELIQGKSNDRGGALYLGGTTTLNRVNVLNSSAASGGAIYLENGTNILNISNSLIQGNTASSGAVLDMACRDALSFNTRTINFNQNSIVENGSNTNNTVLVFCGAPTATLTANTIAKNTANTGSGSILKFNNDQTTNSLAQTSSLTLDSNTIVENTAYSTFLYDQIGTKKLILNALFGNTGKSCRFASGDVAQQTSTGLSLSYNALVLSGAKDGQCDVSNEVLKTEHNTVDVSNISFSNLLEYVAASANTNFLPVYFPKNNQTLTDLVNVGTSVCNGQSDQRGIKRITDGTLLLNPTENNSCDIGSIELVKLTAADVNALVNTSLVDLFTNSNNSGYENQRDYYKSLIDDSATDSKLLPAYNEQYQKYNDLVINTKANLKYRAIYLDPFTNSIADEDSNHKILPLNTDNYKVSVERYGIGTLSSSGSSATVTKLRDDENLLCEWNPTLKRVIISRKDDQITQSEEYNICKYTLTSKVNQSSTSSGLLFAQFKNIAPIATNDEYTIQYGSDQKLTVNLLANDSDDGDGPTSTLVNNPNKPKFYRNFEDVELPIRLTNVPSGITVTADRSGTCPGDDIANICYGGNLYIQVKNNFNPFNYQFSYVIYDAEGLKSNEATVKLINTATTTNDSRGGGGSFGILSLIGLMGLVGYRRFKQ